MITTEQLNKIKFDQVFRCDGKLLKCIKVIKDKGIYCDKCFFRHHYLSFCLEVECRDRIFVDAGIPSIIEVDI
ncbi:MAG TPA: hypothetical protein PK151_05260 [Caldisericia bacterium]|nr:hypothetical protein [Caldisericia bacterium]